MGSPQIFCLAITSSERPLPFAITWEKRLTLWLQIVLTCQEHISQIICNSKELCNSSALSLVLSLYLLFGDSCCPALQKGRSSREWNWGESAELFEKVCSGPACSSPVSTQQPSCSALCQPILKDLFGKQTEFQAQPAAIWICRRTTAVASLNAPLPLTYPASFLL